MHSLTRNVKRCLNLLWMVRNSPSQMALGLTLGLGLGVLPKDNLLAISLAIGIIYLPANLGCGLLAMTLGLIIGPGLDGVTHPLGQTLHAAAPLKSLLIWSYNQPFLPWFGLHNSVVMGTTLLLCVISPIQYFSCRKFFTILRRVSIQNQADRVVFESKRYQRSLMTMRDKPNRIELAIANEGVISFEEVEAEEPVAIADPESTSDDSNPNRFVDLIRRDPVIRDPMIRIDHPESDPLTPSGTFEKQGERVSVLVGGTEASQREAAAIADTVQSQMLRPGLRVDIVLDGERTEEADAAKPESAGSYEDRSQSVVGISSENLQLGDILRETLIEVVRFRSAIQNQPDIQNFGQRPDFAFEGPSASIASSVGFQSNHDASPVPIQEFAYPMHVQTRPSVSMNPVGVEIVASVALTKPEEKTQAPLVPPAEESLRYLLWHLSSLNRESKQ